MRGEGGVAVKNESFDLQWTSYPTTVIKHYGKRSTSILIFMQHIDIKFLEQDRIQEG